MLLSSGSAPASLSRRHAISESRRCTDLAHAVIRRDPSHTDITVLLDRSVLFRQFGNWSMRCAGDDEASAHGTSFMIGFAMGERTAASKRLYEIVLSSHAGNVE
jgi:hypothetical protein